MTENRLSFPSYNDETIILIFRTSGPWKSDFYYLKPDFFTILLFGNFLWFCGAVSLKIHFILPRSWQYEMLCGIFNFVYCKNCKNLVKMNIHKKSLTSGIFNAIRLILEESKEIVFSLGPLFEVLTSRKTMGQAMAMLGNYYDPPRFRSNFRVAITRLKKKRLIKFTDKDRFTLTEGGKGILLKFEIDDIKLSDFNPRKWDGNWRVLIFDIPEISRAARDLFRDKIRELGFYTLQKSVYVTPRPCEKEIMDLARILKINKGVHVLEAKKLGLNEVVVKKFFGIK